MAEKELRADLEALLSDALTEESDMTGQELAQNADWFDELINNVVEVFNDHTIARKDDSGITMNADGTMSIGPITANMVNNSYAITPAAANWPGKAVAVHHVAGPVKP